MGDATHYTRVGPCPSPSHTLSESKGNYIEFGLWNNNLQGQGICFRVEDVDRDLDIVSDSLNWYIYYIVTSGERSSERGWITIMEK